VTVEQLGKQGAELFSFSGIEAGEEFVLDGIGVPLEFLEVLPAGGGKADDVAAPVGGVCLAVDVMAAFEAVEDAVDVIAVKAETAADFSLAE
jgi:threonine dehydratase